MTGLDKPTVCNQSAAMKKKISSSALLFFYVFPTFVFGILAHTHVTR